MSSTKCTRSGKQYNMTHREKVYKQSQTRKPKTKKTTAAQKIINNKVRLKNEIQAVDVNFCPYDSCFFTLTFADTAPTYDVAKKAFDNFCRRLKRAFPQVKYCAVYHEGIKSGRAHFHTFISCKDRVAIESIWGNGGVEMRYLRPDSQRDTVRYMYNGAKSNANQSLFINSRNLVKAATIEIGDLRYDDLFAILDKMCSDKVLDYSFGSNSLLGRYITATIDKAEFDYICHKCGMTNPFADFL